MNDIKGAIYIMVNPSFPQYIKIGYANDVQKRLKDLNSSECIPFSFRLYAYYKVSNRLADIAMHGIIDMFNKNLRASEQINGRIRKREFFALSPDKAYNALKNIAKINGLEENLVLVEPTENDNEMQQTAQKDLMKNSKRGLPRVKWLIENHVINIGDKVYIINKPNEIATVVDDKNVDYNGKILSFNKFGLLVTGWKAIDFYESMKIVGNDLTISDLRKNKMKELGMLK